MKTGSPRGRLRRSDCSDPGLRRRGRGRGFEYLDEAGKRVADEETLARIRELAACPNVHAKLGGLGMRMFGFDLHTRELPPSSEELAAAWRPYIETCIAAFGPERAMFESNFPVDKGSCSYHVLWNAFKRIAGGCSAAEKQALFAGTATQFYQLG